MTTKIGQSIRRFITHESVPIIIFIGAIIIAGVFTYSFLRITSLDRQVTTLRTDLATTNTQLSELSNNFASTTLALFGTTGALSQNLAATASNLSQVQNQVGGVAQTVGSITGKVDTLQKLSTIDAELLKKYSKVYFLNENFAPAHLTLIPQEYVYSNTRQEQFLTEAWWALQGLLNDAKNAGVELYVKSAFRSFSEQQALKSNYTVTYGAGTANSFSADQGYSEHQLATAVDFITGGLNGQLTNAFDTTQAYQWLAQNAYKYGFEMSYPKGNDYYVYEPWHWRFVGKQLASDLHNTNKNFYDMDQRDIDTYLANLFDR
jgi:LAS superfamily LD-carboxypeptidase LdcB